MERTSQELMMNEFARNRTRFKDERLSRTKLAWWLEWLLTGRLASQGFGWSFF